MSTLKLPLRYRVDLADPDSLVAAHAGDAATRHMLKAFRREAEDTARLLAGPAGGAGLAALKGAAGALNKLLGGPLRDEMAALAAAAGATLDEVLLANIAYDLYACDPSGSATALGCSTFIRDTTGGPLHARNLDWGFSGGVLRTYSCVTEYTNGAAGDFTTVGWPGFVGALTGIAPGRFSITVNYVRHTEDSSVVGLAKRALQGHWPVSFLVRHVLETAPNYRAAVKTLRSADLLAPVLFAVAGTKPGEGAVIERGVDTWAERPLAGDTVCTTNHYAAPEYEAENLGDDEIDTHDRYDFLAPQLTAGGGGDPQAAFRLLSRAALKSEITQHQVVMRPADGLLEVRVPR